MNYISSFRRLSRAKQISVLLLISFFTWSVGVSSFLVTAQASQISSISATASSSVPTAGTNYLLAFTTQTLVATGTTIVIQFSATKSGGTDEYSLASLATTEVTSPQIDIITGACGVATLNQASISGGIANSAGNRSVTLTTCGGITTGAKQIWFTGSHVVNPTTVGSYKISVTTPSDSGIAMAAILNQVTVTAAVDTTLTFTVTGVSTSSPQSINGESVSASSSATTIPFGVLASGTPAVAAQDLLVSTNAQNGFIVTVHEDQNLLSANGADIDLFNNGAVTATPIGWATPTATLGVENTYGHMGLTSNDTDLNANEFFSGGVIKWAGNFNSTSTRTIFSNTGPADGATQNVGIARVGYKILVSNLQEAATDYTNHLIYVCTPTF